MKDLQYGIEIETVGLAKSALAAAIHSVTGGTISGYDAYSVVMPDGRTWRVVHDGSLSGLQNGEIVSPILAYADIELLQNVVRAVRAAGARTDSTTGIHIHVGANGFGAKHLANLAKVVHKQERLLEHALGVAPHRLGRYCQPIDASFMRRLEEQRPRTLAEMNTAWYGRQQHSPSRYDDSRYHGLNLNSFFFRGTIEFRYFNGTLHAGEIKAYIQFVLALAAKAHKAKTASSRRREFNVATAKYDWRVFLLGLGLIGSEFKTARFHLTKNLAGSAAWKGERRDRRSVQTEETAATATPVDRNS